MWRPEPKALKRIRDAIASDPKAWQRCVAGRELKAGCGMMGESLKRPPPGYDPEHPFIEDIKRKDFAISVPLDDAAVTGPRLLDVVSEAFESHAPFNGFLAHAVGLTL